MASDAGSQWMVFLGLANMYSCYSSKKTLLGNESGKFTCIQEISLSKYFF